MYTKMKVLNMLRYIAAIVATLCFSYSSVSMAKQQGPSIEQWHTSNGAKVLFVASSELPMIDLRVVFDAGSAKDAEQPGLALLSNGLLSEGTGGLDATAIAKHFESLGARFSNGSYRDMAILSLRSLSDEKLLTPALDMFARVLSQPSYPEDSFERERKRLLVSIQASKESIGNVTDKAFYKTIYGDHPYAQPSKGTEESVALIKLENLRKFHQQYYVGSNAIVAIMGDLNRKQAEDLAEKVVGNLPKGKPASIVPAPKKTQAKTVRIHHPSQQTHLMMGHPGMTRTDPDFFPLYLGNHVLGGGGLVSRLSEEIREKRGLSYSAYSGFSPMRAKGPYTLGLQTRNDQAEEALKVMQQTLSDYIENGPTDEELLAAKRNITGSFPLRLSSNKSIVEYLSLIGFYNLPLDYLDTFNAKIEEVTKEDIIDAYQRRVSMDQMMTIVVGGEQ